jgi:hypothetical protein
MNSLTQLREAIAEYYNTSELKILCSDIGVDFEELAGEDKPQKVQELLLFLHRRQQLPRLIAYCARTRPNVSWQNLLDGSAVLNHPPGPMANNSLANVVSLVRETVRVEIFLRSVGTRAKVEMPFDAKVGTILPTLVSRLGLPLEVPGASINYCLDNKKTGVRLDNNLSLRENGIVDGDILYISGEFTAG